MPAEEYRTITGLRQLRAQKIYILKQAEPKTRLKGRSRGWVQPPRQTVCNCPHYGQKASGQLRVVRLPSTADRERDAWWGRCWEDHDALFFSCAWPTKPHCACFVPRLDPCSTRIWEYNVSLWKREIYGWRSLFRFYLVCYACYYLESVDVHKNYNVKLTFDFIIVDTSSWFWFSVGPLQILQDVDIFLLVNSYCN